MAADAETPSGFVDGQWLVVAQQAAIGAEFDDFSLAKRAGEDWVVVVADITNTGSDATFAIDDLELGAVDGGTAGAVAPEKVLPATKFGASKVEADNTVAIADSQTARVVLAYTSDAVSEKDAALVLGDQVLPLQRTLVDELDSSNLDKPDPFVVEQANLLEANGSELTVSTADGVAILSGLSMPEQDGCYGPESSTAVLTMTGGTVWLQKDSQGEGDLVWYWDASAGGLALLNAALVEQGFAGFANRSESSIGTWLQVLAEEAEQKELGLWALCRNATGVWINEPTPSAEQVRAKYKEVDVRDLKIRSGSFEGEKIVVAGSVFNIYADATSAEIQIMVTAPDGSTEPVYVYYEGDTQGIYEGSWITVYGTASGMYSFQNIYGATISQPLILADIVDF
ncbi:MAG: hypothetical protein ACTHQE_15180 [Thermomicrobiales bacterium]